MLSPYNLEGIENTAIPSPKSVGKYLGKDRVVDKQLSYLVVWIGPINLSPSESSPGMRDDVAECEPKLPER